MQLRFGTRVQRPMDDLEEEAEWMVRHVFQQRRALTSYDDPVLRNIHSRDRDFAQVRRKE